MRGDNFSGHGHADQFLAIVSAKLKPGCPDGVPFEGILLLLKITLNRGMRRTGPPVSNQNAGKCQIYLEDHTIFSEHGSQL